MRQTDKTIFSDKTHDNIGTAKEFCSVLHVSILSDLVYVRARYSCVCHVFASMSGVSVVNVAEMCALRLFTEWSWWPWTMLLTCAFIWSSLNVSFVEFEVTVLMLLTKSVIAKYVSHLSYWEGHQPLCREAVLLNCPPSQICIVA
jgi:hypothetical protein